MSGRRRPEAGAPCRSRGGELLTRIVSAVVLGAVAAGRRLVSAGWSAGVVVARRRGGRPCRMGERHRRGRRGRRRLHRPAWSSRVVDRSALGMRRRAASAIVAVARSSPPRSPAQRLAAARRRLRRRSSASASSLLRLSPDYGLARDRLRPRGRLGDRHRRLLRRPRSIGGPKLWPAVSPKKTWAGAIGGLVAGDRRGLVVARCRRRRRSTSALVVVVAVLSIACQAGDLFEVLGEAPLRRQGCEHAHSRPRRPDGPGRRPGLRRRGSRSLIGWLHGGAGDLARGLLAMVSADAPRSRARTGRPSGAAPDHHPRRHRLDRHQHARRHRRAPGGLRGRGGDRDRQCRGLAEIARDGRCAARGRSPTPPPTAT